VTPLLLAALLAAAPVPDCPAGSALVGGAPPEAFEAWCEGRPDAYGHPRRHGPSRSWYDDGALHVEERYHEGKRDGPYVEYHRNGRPARAGSYALDDLTGRWSVWFESGQLEEQVEYLRSLRHGRFAAWHRNGQRRTEGRFCLGQQCGTWITWDEQGRELGRMEFGEQRATP
jgi:antitoxin component YwqK of YwqJK toxin-antitoxin module